MLGVIRVDFYRNYAIIANYHLARRRRKMPFQIPLPAPSDPPIVSCSRGMIGLFNALIYGILLPIGRAALGVKSKFPCFQGKPEGTDQRQLDSFWRCCPDVSKLPGSSQCSNAVFSAGHSLSRIENQQVSRLRALVTVAWRNIPS